VGLILSQVIRYKTSKPESLLLSIAGVVMSGFVRRGVYVTVYDICVVHWHSE
jgi:hypothetical protein